MISGASLLNQGLEVLHKFHRSLQYPQVWKNRIQRPGKWKPLKPRARIVAEMLPAWLWLPSLREWPFGGQALPRHLAPSRRVDENKAFRAREKQNKMTVRPSLLQQRFSERSPRWTQPEEMLPAMLHHQMDRLSPSLKSVTLCQMRKSLSLPELKYKAHLFHLLCEQ